MKEPCSRTHTRTRQEAVLERGKSHRTICLFENLIGNVFAKKHAKMKEADTGTHARCQNEAALERGKSHRTISLFVNLMTTSDAGMIVSYTIG